MTTSRNGLLAPSLVCSLLAITVGCGGGGTNHPGGSGGSGASHGGGSGGTTTGSGGGAGGAANSSGADSGATDAAPLTGDCKSLYDCCVGPALQTAQFCVGLVAQGICDVWLEAYSMAGIQCAAGATGGDGGADVGGTTGTGGAGGASGDGGLGGASGGLPACAIVTRPPDPSDPNTSATGGTCNTLSLSGQPVSPGALIAVDAGARVDGGGLETPIGGQLLDGDYEFIAWLDNSAPGPSRRELRVFGGGTYIEWAATLAGSGSGGSDLTIKYDTTASAAGHTLNLSYDCGNEIIDASYGYSASGDQLTLFDGAEGVQTGTLVAVDTYRRICTRP